MKVLKFVRTGTAHMENNMECQDVAEYRQSESTTIMVLSDGASKAKYGRIGAECNVNAVINLFQQITIEDFIEMSEGEQTELILEQCKHWIREAAIGVNCKELHQFSATLIFVIIDENYILTGHLGDGAIYMTNVENKHCFSSDPENIGVAHRTYFTVSEDAFEHLHLSIVRRMEIEPAIAMIVIISDGPYLMFKDRGFGQPNETVEEMSPFLTKGQVRTEEMLEILLNEMTELESEKSDDWSILVAVVQEKEETEDLQEVAEDGKEENRTSVD